MPKGEVVVNYSARLSASDLPVGDELVGEDPSFELSEKTVWIRLPGDRKRREYMRRTTFFTNEGGVEVPMAWDVNWISIHVEAGATLFVADVDDLPHSDDTPDEHIKKTRKLAYSDVSKAGIIGENFVRFVFDSFAKAVRTVKMNGTLVRIPKETQMGGTKMMNAHSGYEPVRYRSHD